MVVSARHDRWFAEFEAKGAAGTTVPAALADRDIAFRCLPNTAIVQQVLLGEAGLLALMKLGQIVVDLSTIT